jgi:hypothetical protein
VAAVAADAGRVIRAESGDGAGFAARLAAKAGRLTAAHVEARRRGERRWRLARLVWPLFAKER